MVIITWVILVGFAVWFLYVFVADIIEHREQLEPVSWIKTGLIGFGVNFLTY